ncbi:hypothetical protein CANARDRAFT_29902 [[Candida] arabinofermentans NRRL YB-2248]|uniref:DUF7907 domain-containing protein n=1 Tax=[Candida] arabinofermentans NRRL YB-2248 TaxID=983967 RepID=A0A1E4SVB4_9ASCO|nr:hypothetical protein CANARDRAFT_29902 [[Candida] arabinofermentans NRRL YB-2248]
MKFSTTFLSLSACALFASVASATSEQYVITAVSPDSAVNGLQLQYQQGKNDYELFLAENATYYTYYYLEDNEIVYPDVEGFRVYMYMNFKAGHQVTMKKSKDTKHKVSFNDNDMLLINREIGEFAACLNDNNEYELYYYNNSLNGKCSPVELVQSSNRTFVDFSIATTQTFAATTLSTVYVSSTASATPIQCAA